MFNKATKRWIALLCAALFLLTAGAALADGGGPRSAIGNTSDGDGLYGSLINGRKIARKAYLSDRYPTVEGPLRVFHNKWERGGWEDKKMKCRISGPMELYGTAYLKGIGMYLDGSAFRSSIEGAESKGAVRYTLNGDYDEFYFGIGPDSSDNRYCGSNDGSARIQIYLDDVIVYDTGFFEFDDVGYDQAIDVRNANKLKIVLTERKGANNTLNVLLTNPLLVDYD